MRITNTFKENNYKLTKIFFRYTIFYVLPRYWRCSTKIFFRSIFYALPLIAVICICFYSHHHSIATLVNPPIIHNSSLSSASIPPFVNPPIIYNSSLSSASIPLTKGASIPLTKGKFHIPFVDPSDSIPSFVNSSIIHNSSLSFASIPPFVNSPIIHNSSLSYASIPPFVNSPIFHNSSLSYASIPPFVNSSIIHNSSLYSASIPPFVNSSIIHNSSLSSASIPPIVNSSIIHNSSLSSASIPLIKAKEKLYEKPCDYTNGKWVYHKRGPLYNGTCSIIKTSLNCIVNGRPDSNYLNWRWKPRKCHLPIFDPNIFLKLIKNMNIVFVGDSLANNQMQSLICLLSTISKPIRVPHIGTDSKWYFPSHNANLSLYWSPFLVKGDQRQKNGPAYNKIYLDRVNEMWAKDIEQMDLIVLAFGHWLIDIPSIYYEGDSIIGCLKCHDFKFKYNDIGFYVPMRKALRTTLNSIIERKVIKGNGIDVIVRTHSPTHFEGGWDKGGTCSKRKPYRSKQKKIEGMDAKIRSIEIEEVENAKEKAKKIGLNLEVLDVTKLALLRPDGHAGAYMNPFPFANGVPKYVQNDCVHWCLPGPIDTWNEIFLEMLKKGKDHAQ